MYGESPKMKMRKMAMESMMKGKPSFEIKSKKERMMAEMNNEGDKPSNDMLDGEEGAGEFISFMVTPEEKAMIMKMRKSGGMSEDMGEEESDSEMEA